jgi:hypothetical protein
MGLYSDLINTKPATQQPRKLETQETGKPATQKPRKPVSQETSKPATQVPGKPGIQEPRNAFDINEKSDHKVTFLITDNDFFAIEELKLGMNRQTGQRVTKDDLARCALNLLITDYQTKGEQSFVVRQLRKKTGK